MSTEQQGLIAEITEDLRSAQQNVQQAETVVTALLARLTTAPRADKVGVSAPLEAALRSLQAAHDALAALQTKEL